MITIDLRDSGKILRVNGPYGDGRKDAILPAPPTGYAWIYKNGTWGSAVDLVPENYKIDKKNYIPMSYADAHDIAEPSELRLPNGQKLFGILPKLPPQNFWILADSEKGVIAYPVHYNNIKSVVKALGLKRFKGETAKHQPELISVRTPSPKNYFPPVAFTMDSKTGKMVAKEGQILRVNFRDQFPNDAVLPEPPAGQLWSYHLGRFDTTVSLVPENLASKYEYDPTFFERSDVDIRNVFMPDGRKLLGVLPKLPPQNFWILADSEDNVTAFPIHASNLDFFIGILGLKREGDEDYKLNPISLKSQTPENILF